MGDNLLYYGDNLDVLRRHIKDESVEKAARTYQATKERL